MCIRDSKKGFRAGPESDRKFNSEGFQIFPVPGFTSFSEFPKNPPSDQYLRKKPTIYWEPLGLSESGVLRIQVKIPYGVNVLDIRLEGRTLDGEPLFSLFQIELK